MSAHVIFKWSIWSHIQRLQMVGAVGRKHNHNYVIILCLIFVLCHHEYVYIGTVSSRMSRTSSFLMGFMLNEVIYTGCQGLPGSTLVCR